MGGCDDHGVALAESAEPAGGNLAERLASDCCAHGNSLLSVLGVSEPAGRRLTAVFRTSRRSLPSLDFDVDLSERLCLIACRVKRFASGLDQCLPLVVSRSRILDKQPEAVVFEALANTELVDREFALLKSV